MMLGMRSCRTRACLAAVASLFAASLLLYSVASVVVSRPGEQPGVELGFDREFRPAERAEVVRSVRTNSPAERAGMRPGDRIVAFDGEPIPDEGFETRVWKRHKPGDRIHLTVLRPGSEAPVFLSGTFRKRPGPSGKDLFSTQLNLWFPWPFAIVGLAVLFLRLEDPNAWVLAALFGGVIASRGLGQVAVRPAWWPAAMAYQAIMIGLVGPLFYWFYARFPAPSALDRRWPWLKWVCAGFGLAVAAGGINDGHVRVPPPMLAWIGGNAADRVAVLSVIVCLALGLVSFAANFFGTRDAEARRKMRLLFWGTALGLGPNLVKLAAQNFTDLQVPASLDSLLAAMMLFIPLAFAYAVLVHRVLEIPVLLRRSARYLLVQRGFTFLLSLASIALTLLFALSFPEIGQAPGIALGAVFGTALLWTGTQVHKQVSGRIDRAFFRSAYDARVILENLAEKSRASTGRAELVRLLEHQLGEALKPRFLRVRLDPDSVDPEPRPELSVPISGREGREFGALLVGPRLSEEPYSREDRRLLASVAGQAAAAIENMQMAEEIAAHLESERRAAREMEIAREVQARLLPQAPPRLRTLECAARCVQARAVGGDYYDFLDLGPGRAGLVLADVSGKGVHAALLVAHLEAYLRSQSAKAMLDPAGMLEEVNRMLYASTAPQHYATVFYGIYSDDARELVYVNCGHNPAVWIQDDGTVARLEATSTVLGLLERWHGETQRMRLEPGGLLAVFSDGVSEAQRGEEEFGEQRLIAELLDRRSEAADSIVEAVLARVQEFSAGAQYDDLTLLVARAT